MLKVGNIMNEGTYRGQAHGFTLDSLLSMVNTKGAFIDQILLDYKLVHFYCFIRHMIYTFFLGIKVWTKRHLYWTMWCLE